MPYSLELFKVSESIWYFMKLFKFKMTLKKIHKITTFMPLRGKEQDVKEYLPKTLSLETLSETLREQYIFLDYKKVI